jgi:hypothetical protein
LLCRVENQRTAIHRQLEDQLPIIEMPFDGIIEMLHKLPNQRFRVAGQGGCVDIEVDVTQPVNRVIASCYAALGINDQH